MRNEGNRNEGKWTATVELKTRKKEVVFFYSSFESFKTEFPPGVNTEKREE